MHEETRKVGYEFLASQAKQSRVLFANLPFLMNIRQELCDILQFCHFVLILVSVTESEADSFLSMSHTLLTFVVQEKKH